MRLLYVLILLMLLSRGLEAQEGKTYRSDTLNFSVQLRYLFISFGAGVEFPFRQHSFGLQAGYNAVPVDGNIYHDFNFEKVVAPEYKRYFRTKSKPGKQFYYGSYLLFKYTKYASPEDQDWEGEWYESNSISVGPLLGYTRYSGKRTYIDLFLGGHGGWQKGELRRDNRDPVSGERNPAYEQAKKVVYGIRLGLSLGFHPVRK